MKSSTGTTTETLQDNVLRLRLSPAPTNSRLNIEATHTSSNTSSTSSNSVNSEYLDSQTVQPWPIELSRPTMAEVRAARIRYFGAETLSPVQAASPVPADNVLVETLPSSFFSDPIPDLGLSTVLSDEVPSLGYLEAQVGRSFDSRETLSRTDAYFSQNFDRNNSSIALSRQRLIENLHRPNHEGLLNRNLQSSDVNTFRSWGPGSIRVPRGMSRHELVISILFSIFSDEILQSVGILLVSGSCSSFFILFVFRRLLITMLNSGFWSQIRSFEVRHVLQRAFGYAQRLGLYRSINNNSVASDLPAPNPVQLEQIRESGRSSVNGVRSAMDFSLNGLNNLVGNLLNSLNTIRQTSVNALLGAYNGVVINLRTSLSGYVRNARAGNYRSILYGVGINLLMIGFASLARSSFLANLLIPARDSVLRWVYASFISIAGAAAGSPSSTSGTPSVPVPSVPSLQSPVVVRDFQADAKRLLDALTEFFMSYF